MICPGQSIAEIVAFTESCRCPGTTLWGKRMLHMRPRNFVELGTGQGASGVHIMQALPEGSWFTTINYDYPSSHGFGELLEPHYGDRRLRMLTVDTTEPGCPELVRGIIDLLYIDTHHVAWQAALELEMWQYKLCHGAIIIADDLDQNDMEKFWGSIHYEKSRAAVMQGMFRYDSNLPYKSPFPRGLKPTEGWCSDKPETWGTL